MYHFIEDPASMKWSVSPQTFKKHIDVMMDLGINSYCVGEELLESAVPPCFITFDDGHKSNLKAAEMLANQGFRACFYVVKDFSMNNSDYLNESEIKEISEMGHLIGVHGKYHRWWTGFDDDQLASDLKETKNWIEDVTGVKVITCSAVGGKINKRIIECINERVPELKYIRTSRFGFNHVGDTIINSIGITKNCPDNEMSNILDVNKRYYSFGRAKYNFKEMIKPIYHAIIK